MVASLVGAAVSNSSKLEWDAVTGRGAKDANGNSKESSEGLTLNAATALITGKGY
jgi:hypothetical protein